MKKKLTSTSIYPETATYLSERFTSVAEGVADTISILEKLIALEKRELVLSESEAMYIFEAMSGVLIDTIAITELHAAIEDAAHFDKLDEKYKIDAEVLSNKIKAMNNLQRLAIIDGVRIFWNTANRDEDGLRLSGLAR